MTETQQAVITILNHRHAYSTAAALQEQWEKGLAGYTDSRISAKRGLARMVKKANEEAARANDSFQPL